MKSQLSRVFAFAAIGWFAVCVSAKPASAQNAAQGSFTLPHEVRWQNATLPAGNYTFELESSGLPNKMIVRGPNGAVLQLSKGISRDAADKTSSLTLERRGGTSFVRDLYLADLGIHLRYSVPAIPRDERQLAQGPAPTEQVLVATAK